MCLRADATTSAIHVRLILPGEGHGDYPPRLCHTPFTRIWPHEELCRFSALDHCSAPFSRACWLALAPPTLLGRGSRHCHGINITHNLGSECKRLIKYLAGQKCSSVLRPRRHHTRHARVPDQLTHVLIGVNENTEVYAIDGRLPVFDAHLAFQVFRGLG